MILREKRERAAQLTQKLADIPHITLPVEPKWGGHVYQSYVILADQSLNRDQIIQDMREMEVETTLGTYALHDQPFFQKKYGYRAGELANSHYAFTRSITLPLYPQLTSDNLEIIKASLKRSIQLKS